MLLATVVTVAVLSVTSPHLATGAAWGHAVIVAFFAILLPLRLRAARRGSVRALRASLIISGAIDTMLGYFDAYPETDVDHYANALADLVVVAVAKR